MVAPRSHSKYLLPVLVSFILVSGCIAEAADPAIKLVNRIEVCHKITIKKVFSHNTLLLADADISSIKSAGYYGCKSAVLSYSARIDEAEKKQQGEYGRFLSFYSGKYTFVINRDYGKKAANRKYNLSIQCAPPD